MYKSRKFYFNLTTLLPLVLSALVSGCSPTEAPQATSTTPISGSENKNQAAASTVTKPNLPLTVAPENPDPTINNQASRYIKSLGAKQFHGVWIQSEDKLLANQQGTVPLPAASITKVATSLVTLQTFGPEHRFITQIGTTGEIKDGVLQGDLVFQGDQDPFFVWEEAMAVGNVLNKMGIKQVAGDLVIVDKFYMNYKTNPEIAGKLLKTALNSKTWNAEATTLHRALPPGTPKPQVIISGSVKALDAPPDNIKPLVRHSSFPIAELLKKMNKYSNNYMAEMLANSVGGAKVVAQKAAETVGVPTKEIQLVNGSGLSPQNKISPRAATALFRAIENYLKPYNMTIADVFAVVGEDKGILSPRPLPQLAVVKSGSLNNVSALAGALPTKNQGTVWFAIMNSGGNFEAFRKQQEIFLNSAVREWGSVATSPGELIASPQRKDKTSTSEIVMR
ncbi:MAG: D-alanyl-D-alanine carboxypeptidase [Scytonematopsis contorta HA4267-MV1]|jgi:D-alanyl-D-alanine carboxypeptidase/D-alanyl-D-alanine-endopeptidase (penicillin-binding protein 4)|nr:D-alanyl-D-alanine carboxypeptidase [Scytonematopsis contorta HA4267-MV1]